MKTGILWPWPIVRSSAGRGVLAPVERMCAKSLCRVDDNWQQYQLLPFHLRDTLQKRSIGAGHTTHQTSHENEGPQALAY